MRNQSFLFELMQSEWLMDLRFLHQLRYNIQANTQDVKHEQVEEKPTQQMISFFNEDLRQVRVSEISEIPEGSIAVINMVGGMMKYRNWYTQSAQEIIRELDFVNSIDNIKAIVINVDGPGGAVSAIPPFIDFASRKRKPIVAICDNALSLHYWIVNAVADHIMAENTISSRFGSVGVVTSWLDLSAYWEGLGVKEHEVYADESNHKNEIWRKIKEDEEAGKKMLRDMQLSPIAKQFQAAVKNNLPTIKEDVEGVLTGRVFDANQALSNNMIHSVGNLESALSKAQILAETAY